MGIAIDAESLLERYKPVVWFDSHEAFFAHDVRAMADQCPEFRLERADRTEVIAVHGPGEDTLSLATLDLRDGTYANGKPYAQGDHLGLHLAGPDQFATLAGDYRAMEYALPATVRDKVFGRAVSDGDDRWLQYWYFYLYNDAQFAGRFDLHEGDWEMVQLKLGDDGVPVLAVYSQHAYSQRRLWDTLEFDGDRPIVYSGRGSHASYFEAGLHRTYVKTQDDEFLPLWWDAADGAGRHVDQQLLPLVDGWVQWRGAWGGTRAGGFKLNGDSPGGPITHGQWGHPTAFARAARDHPREDPAPAPAIKVRRSSSGLEINFDFSHGPSDRTAPDRLLVTAASDGLPPVTETIVVDTLLEGQVVTRRSLEPDRSYRISVSTISGAGVPTAPADTDVGPLTAEHAPGVLAPLLRHLDHLWERVGDDDARRV